MTLWSPHIYTHVLALCAYTHTGTREGEEDRCFGRKWVSRRQLEKGCGKSGVGWGGWGGGWVAEGVGPYKETWNTGETLSLLSVLLTQTWQETFNSPNPLPCFCVPHLLRSHSPASYAESDQRWWLHPCGEWMGCTEELVEFSCSGFCCLVVSSTLSIYVDLQF